MELALTRIMGAIADADSLHLALEKAPGIDTDPVMKSDWAVMLELSTTIKALSAVVTARVIVLCESGAQQIQNAKALVSVFGQVLPESLRAALQMVADGKVQHAEPGALVPSAPASRRRLSGKAAAP